MNFARRLLMVSGAVMLAGIVGVLFTPKALQAVATAVNVVNQQANPVPVREANSPDIYPFVIQFCINGQVNGTFFSGECTVDGSNNGSSSTIPSTTPDNVAVLFADIDNVSAVCTFLSTNNAVDQVLTVGTTFQGVFGGDTWEFLVPHISNVFAITNQGTRIYADPGSQIFVSLNGSNPQAKPCGVTLSGHLVTH